MAEEGAIDDLRRRVDEVRSRHEADGRAAARAFWDSLRHSEAHEAAGPAAGGPATGSGCSGGPAASAASAASRRRTGPRKGGARTRQSLIPRGRGLWAHVAPADELTTTPRQMEWADDLDDGDDDARWQSVAEAGQRDERPQDPDGGDTPEGAAAHDATWTGSVAGAPGLVGLQVDAIAGRPLDRHGEVEVLVAAEQVASLRGQHDVMLVNLVAELEARGVESPGGLSRLDWLRSLDPGLSAGQAKAFVTVARAITQPAWAQLAARVTMQHVSVGKAAQIIDFHERTAPVADPDDLTTAVEDLVEQAGKGDAGGPGPTGSPPRRAGPSTA